MSWLDPTGGLGFSGDRKVLEDISKLLSVSSGTFRRG